jgi:hypothetical protein
MRERGFARDDWPALFTKFMSADILIKVRSAMPAAASTIPIRSIAEDRARLR